MSGILPISTTNKMFIDGSDFSYIANSGSEYTININTAGVWFVGVRFYGNNTEHLSSYVFSQAGIYAKSIQQLSIYNYNNNSSVTVDVSSPGAVGFTIKATYASLSEKIFVKVYRIV